MTQPTDSDDAAALEQQLRAERRQGHDFVVAEDGYVRDEVARKAVHVVADYRREHRRGPTWREFAQQMGWTRAQAEGGIAALCEHEILQTGTRPRSMRLHPRLRPTKHRRRRSRRPSTPEPQPSPETTGQGDQ